MQDLNHPVSVEGGALPATRNGFCAAPGEVRSSGYGAAQELQTRAPALLRRS
jgi:hypothetical protein